MVYCSCCLYSSSVPLLQDARYMEGLLFLIAINHLLALCLKLGMFPKWVQAVFASVLETAFMRRPLGGIL